VIIELVISKRRIKVVIIERESGRSGEKLGLTASARG
jgi:hypothetical protein